jgi:hypothetical protein
MWGARKPSPDLLTTGKHIRFKMLPRGLLLQERIVFLQQANDSNAHPNDSLFVQKIKTPNSPPIEAWDIIAKLQLFAVFSRHEFNHGRSVHCRYSSLSRQTAAIVG